MLIFDRDVASGLSDAVSSRRSKSSWNVLPRLFPLLALVSPMVLDVAAFAQVPTAPPDPWLSGARPGRQRGSAGQAKSKPVKSDHSISPIRVDMVEGVFLILDAAMPPNTDQPGQAGPG